MRIKPELPELASQYGIIIVCPDGNSSWYCFKEELFAVVPAPKNDGFITYRLFNWIAAWAGGETESFVINRKLPFEG